MNDLIERLRLGDGTSPDHWLLLEAADALEKSVECMCGICKLGPTAAQPTQEPVAYVAEIVADVNGALSTRWIDWWTPNEGDKLYTTPSQRTWVGLTDEEIWTVLQFRGYSKDNIEIAKAIEAKLKEKNT